MIFFLSWVSQVLGRSWVYQGRPLLDKPWANRPDSSVLFCLPSNLYTVMMPAALSCQKLGLLKVLTTPLSASACPAICLVLSILGFYFHPYTRRPSWAHLLDERTSLLVSVIMVCLFLISHLPFPISFLTHAQGTFTLVARPFSSLIFSDRCRHSHDPPPSSFPFSVIIHPIYHRYHHFLLCCYCIADEAFFFLLHAKLTG